MLMFVGRLKFFQVSPKIGPSSRYANHCYGFVKLSIRSSFRLFIYFDAIFENIYFELPTTQKRHNIITSKRTTLFSDSTSNLRRRRKEEFPVETFFTKPRTRRQRSVGSTFAFVARRKVERRRSVGRKVERRGTPLGRNALGHDQERK
jgi:hypothetical protein